MGLPGGMIPGLGHWSDGLWILGSRYSRLALGSIGGFKYSNCFLVMNFPSLSASTRDAILAVVVG